MGFSSGLPGLEPIRSVDLISMTRSLSEIEFPQPSIAINSPRDRQILGSK